MKWYEKAAGNISEGMKYTRRQLVSILQEETPMLKTGSYQWAVGEMLKNGYIVRVGFDEYMLSGVDIQPEYEPRYSELASELLNVLEEKYSYSEFTIFETVLMNDFLNHLIAQNTVFVQFEKDLSIFAFRFLQETDFGHVLYKPSKRDFDLYWGADCIVITDMRSEAPLSVRAPHSITMEKMLVDIYCDRLIRETYSKAEYPSVMEHALRTYKVEKTKLLRYAGRRNKAEEIERIISELT